jgi:HAD superfamily hydrolase (TIGR01549 family)
VSDKRFFVRGLFFDLDGTIVDSRDAYFEASRIAFEAVGRKPLGFCASLEIPKRLEQGLSIEDLVRSDTKQFLNTYLQSFYSLTKTKTKTFPNVKATLETLSRHAKLALITMRYVPKANVIDELKQFNLAQPFTYIITALDAEKPKPSPQALIKTIKHMDINMCDCAIIGDSVTDMQCGKAAGTKTIAVLTGLYTRQELEKEKPDLILEDLTKLAKYLIFPN